MAKQTEELAVQRASLHLISFGLLAAMITIWFGFTCFVSIPGINRGTSAGARIGDVGVEFNNPRSSSANTSCPPARPTKADRPSAVERMIVIPSMAQDWAESAGFGSAWNFRMPPDQDPSLTERKLGDALATPAAPKGDTPSFRSNEQQPAAVLAAQTVEPMSSSPNASPIPSPDVPIADRQRPAAIPPMQIAEPRSSSSTASPVPAPAALIADKGREQPLQTFQIPPTPEQTVLASQSSVAANAVQGRPSSENPSGSQAALQYRMRRECGPINDRELHAQCIRSFFSYRTKRGALRAASAPK